MRPRPDSRRRPLRGENHHPAYPPRHPQERSRILTTTRPGHACARARSRVHWCPRRGAWFCGPDTPIVSLHRSQPGSRVTCTAVAFLMVIAGKLASDTLEASSGTIVILVDASRAGARDLTRNRPGSRSGKARSAIERRGCRCNPAHARTSIADIHYLLPPSGRSVSCPSGGWTRHTRRLDVLCSRSLSSGSPVGVALTHRGV